jgi:hypothetical protein
MARHSVAQLGLELFALMDDAPPLGDVCRNRCKILECRVQGMHEVDRARPGVRALLPIMQSQGLGTHSTAEQCRPERAAVSALTLKRAGVGF